MTDSPENNPIYVGKNREDCPKSNPEGYKVGRGEPPKHTQFEKGQSGNPKGRPKGREAGSKSNCPSITSR